MTKIDLSIIVPVLNEAESLPALLGDLERQQQLDFEVLVVDGGSSDDTVTVASRHFDKGPLAGQCLVSDKGRGRQLNAGARKARADWLLFLHADSRIADPCQLSKALASIVEDVAALSSDAVVGRFALKFDVSAEHRSFAYYYYENKARLNRPGCFHGDQGMLLKTSFFNEIGPFREDLPVMEDTSLAEAVRSVGRWLLLPGKIVTSARRFESEGIKERQILNALMMNFRAIGWDDFFRHAPEVYRQQKQAEKLSLQPFFLLIRRLLKERSFKQRWRLWLATGRYVRSQAWQIGFMFDCRKAYRNNIAVPTNNDWLNRFDRWFDPATDHVVGHFVTAILVRLWFALRCIV